ncbi:MAG TPA: oligosaccharide flippase family protein [Saprospiraceae bacterium]|nr:oligosaccharide flippase family protein [Saprospiraceae bacterium]HRO08182.1 oligosaccharide flippase family protein [Saprospiraceae bacterium]HRP41575.1 oligosaccharide flippase family protein [Saprospiraceae bacterium]
MLRSLLKTRYLYYGGSIVVSRGLEYIVLFFAAHFLAKEDYGELEFYKKAVEIGSNILAFGFPALILSYTKSDESKIYFYWLSVFFVLGLGLLLLVAGIFYPIAILLVLTMVFYALFFSGGIAQSFQIVHLGSNFASIYKIVVSVLFYGSVLGLVNFWEIKGQAYLFPSVLLLPLALLYAYMDFRRVGIVWDKVSKYWQLFKKLLLSSFTLVVSNFANLLFLYTDILVIKWLSSSANLEIADFSFALNVAGILLIISMTLIQVDIEKLKVNAAFLHALNIKIVVLTLIVSVLLIVGYYVLITHFFEQFGATFWLFLIILAGKFCLTVSNLFGTYLVILKKFTLNLNINLVFLLANIVSCILGYQAFGLIGLAVSSSVMLALRLGVLMFFNYKAVGYKL